MKFYIVLGIIFSFCSSLFSLDIGLDLWEDSYFELSGIWQDSFYGEDYVPQKSSTYSFSWGVVENFDPEAGSIIDLGSETPSIDYLKVLEIKRINDIFRIKLDISASKQKVFHVYMKREDDFLIYLERDDSLYGAGKLKKVVGPMRVNQEGVGISTMELDLHIIPVVTSTVVDHCKNGVSLRILEKTVNSGFINEFTPWIKVETESGSQGWVVASQVMAIDETK